MNNSTRYIIRIPTSNLEESLQVLNRDRAYTCLHLEQNFLQAWILIDEQIITIKESEQKYPSLVKYLSDSQSEVERLDSLGILCDFEADEVGAHFEASFFDPGGLKISIADLDDLPADILKLKQKASFELAIPCGPSFTDSINFWNLFGFSIQSDKPKPHTWSTLVDQNFKIGLHQHYMWNEPGLCFPSNSYIKKSQIAEANLRSKLYFSDFF